MPIVKEISKAINSDEVRRLLPYHSKYWNVEDISGGELIECCLNSSLHQTPQYNREPCYKPITLSLKFVK